MTASTPPPVTPTATPTALQIMDYLEKLNKVCQGALTSLAAGKTTDNERARDQTQWWNGYEQAVSDVTEALLNPRHLR